MIELKAYAGLIRNYRALAHELAVDITSDSRRAREEKLMLKAYERWGQEMGLHINGQFAAVFFDSETQDLFGIRDVLGAELLFYYETANHGLLYGLTISDLFTQSGFKRAVNEEMIQFYLGLSYIPGEETLFKGVYKVAPGGYFRFHKGKLELGQWWTLAFSPDESKSLDEWAHELSDAVDASMHDICDADEVCDSFLSGGVDSSYMLAKSRARTGYCASYAEQSASEEDEARATAAYLHRDFEGIEVTPEQFFATIDEFLRAYEQPSSDAAGLSLYCACKTVAKKSSLCFSGEGADEFFAGYNGYGDTSRFDKQANPVYYGATQAMRELDQKHYLRHYCNKRSVKEFMRARGMEGRAYDTVSWMLYTDLRSYFEGSILFNSTKISRGTGLDIRMPYCDLRIFRIALAMPSRFKVSSSGNKLALRKAASWVLPEEVAYRKKLGFPVPIKDWLANPAYNQDIFRAFQSETAAKFFKPKEIQALLAMFTGQKTNIWHKLRYRDNTGPLWRRVWSIYLFIRWYELFFTEEPTQQ